MRPSKQLACVQVSVPKAAISSQIYRQFNGASAFLEYLRTLGISNSYGIKIPSDMGARVIPPCKILIAEIRPSIEIAQFEQGLVIECDDRWRRANVGRKVDFITLRMRHNSRLM